MVATTITSVRTTRAKLRQVMAQIPAMLAGKAPDQTGAVRGLQLAVGIEALSFIKEAFLARARGGADESGLTWPPLAKSTVAYSRRHPGIPPATVRRAYAPSYALTEPQRKRWWDIYGRGTGGQGQRAALAWAILKAEGAVTLMMKFGDTPVEILRDTDLLLNSLSPGVDGPSGHPNQVFRLEQGAVVVGTNRKYALVHHLGSARIPRRPLWPDPEKWPASWWERLQNQARDGVTRIVALLLQGGGQ